MTDEMGPASITIVDSTGATGARLQRHRAQQSQLPLVFYVYLMVVLALLATGCATTTGGHTRAALAIGPTAPGLAEPQLTSWETSTHRSAPARSILAAGGVG